MYPKHHLIFGILFALILFFFFPKISITGFAIIILSTFLIDIDHYAYYVCKKNDWNLKNAYKWFIEHEKTFSSLSRKKREEFYSGICFLHGAEILVVLFLLIIFTSRLFLFIFIGLAFHLLLDIVYGVIYIDRIDKFSIVHDFLKFKKLKFIDKDVSKK